MCKFLCAYIAIFAGSSAHSKSLEEITKRTLNMTMLDISGLYCKPALTKKEAEVFERFFQRTLSPEEYEELNAIRKNNLSYGQATFIFDSNSKQYCDWYRKWTPIILEKYSID